MQTYTFDELDERGQIAAFDRYAHVIEPLHPHRDNTVQEVRAELRSWRFTEHGERIASHGHNYIIEEAEEHLSTIRVRLGGTLTAVNELSNADGKTLALAGNLPSADKVGTVLFFNGKLVFDENFKPTLVID